MELGGLVVEFTPEVCGCFYNFIFRCYEKTFDFKKVAVSMDNRPSSPEIAGTVCVL